MSMESVEVYLAFRDKTGREKVAVKFITWLPTAVKPKEEEAVRGTVTWIYNNNGDGEYNGAFTHKKKGRGHEGASSGSSSSSSSSSSGSSSSGSSHTGSSSSDSSSSSSLSSSPSTSRQRHNRRRSRSMSKSTKKEEGDRRRRSPTPKPTKLSLGRLTRNVVKGHIQEIFSTYGEIKHIEMPMNRLQPHLSKGYAYVEFQSPYEAEKALKHMDGGQIDGQEITVTAVLTPIVRPPPRRLPPPPPMWRRSPPRIRRRSPRRRSPIRRGSRSLGRRRHRSRSSSNSSR
uniref:RRM domain-containing protein n=1 Tax=Knipowitschia caucasica TaxID=637954 RepID=A0AAV2LTU4_KNICA